MCEIITTAIAGLGLGGGAATAAGATAAATTAGAGLKTFGTILSIGGGLVQGIQTSQAMRAQSRELQRQAQEQAQLTSIKDNRERMEFRRAMAQQTAELAARGVDLNSPSAIYLGETAAREMAFNSQAIRQTGASQGRELTAASRAANARASMGLLSGGLSAAGAWLNRRPDEWPELRR